VGDPPIRESSLFSPRPVPGGTAPQIEWVSDVPPAGRRAPAHGPARPARGHRRPRRGERPDPRGGHPQPGRGIPELAAEIPEISECRRITGEDCFFLKVHLRSIDDLSLLLDRFLLYGETTTSIINASPIPGREPPVTAS
jgi:hypothetical protein